MSLDPTLKMFDDNVIEKNILRKSFEGYLPDELLYRRKEAFSDGVSSLQRSWYEIIDEKVEKALLDEEITDDWRELLEEYKDRVNPPTTKEQYIIVRYLIFIIRIVKQRFLIFGCLDLLKLPILVLEL